LRVVTFKIEDDLLELLDRYAIKHKLNRSEAIRRAIERMIKEEFKDEIIPPMKIEKIKL
jgi:metal-responsive CopG/Arc/MetJ family transcriptional regulator